MISDSASTERSTWRREAPSVRSVANSRVRCAIVIDSELAITNAPTNSAIPANASSSVFRKPSELSSELVSVCACWAPVRTWASRGRIGLIWSTSCCGLVPLLAATLIESSWPGLENSRCAVASVKPVSVVPPSELAEPNLTIPEILRCSSGPSAWTPIGWPTFRCFLEAVLVSTTTPVAPGQWPETSFSELSCGADGSTLEPSVGLEPNETVLPLSTSCAVPETPPDASATPGSRLTRASNVSGKVGTSPPLAALAPVSIALRPVIEAAVFL